MKTIARKGKKLFNRDKSQPLIFWCCEDHEFDVKERKHNPASYYADVYDIKLKYPHLPVICSGNNEFFPVEFLFQEVGRIPREGNEDQERLKEVLEYHDTHAGPRRLQHIKNLKTLASNNPAGPDVLGLTDLVRKFGFKVSDQTSIVDAKWLQSPALHFDGSFERNTERGSWNLLRKKFAK